MRTTLSIDDDVLDAAKEIAARQNRSLGEVISSLARGGLSPSNAKAFSREVGAGSREENAVKQRATELRHPKGTAKHSSDQKNGLPLLPFTASGGPITLDIVNALRDETY